MKRFKFKFDVTWPILVICVFCAIICLWPDEYSHKTKLLSITQIQMELVSRGHDIKVDGKFGPNTQLALDIEMSKN
jgi:hypothetical protein